jgi:hypothetical protein
LQDVAALDAGLRDVFLGRADALLHYMARHRDRVKTPGRLQLNGLHNSAIISN